MGTQDSFSQAEDFLERGNVSTPLMTWDESFATWEHYEVRGQPVTILLGPDGDQLGRWNGITREMLDLVDQF